jgi:hypothetical protein
MSRSIYSLSVQINGHWQDKQRVLDAPHSLTAQIHGVSFAARTMPKSGEA